MRTAPRLLVPALTVAVVAGCGTADLRVGSTDAGAAANPVTADSCGRTVTFEAPPERVLAIGSEAPSLLTAAGAGAAVTHYACSLAVPFDPETEAVVERAQRVTEDSHDVSLEMILESGVDAVIGTDISSGVDIDSLAARLDQAGVQLLTVSGYCAGIEGRSTGDVGGFDLIYRDIATYGRVFGTEQQAATAVAALRDRVAVATERVARQSDRSAVPLYVPAEGTLGS